MHVGMFAQVEFDGGYPLEGAKQVNTVCIRYLARIVRNSPHGSEVESAAKAVEESGFSSRSEAKDYMLHACSAMATGTEEERQCLLGDKRTAGRGGMHGVADPKRNSHGGGGTVGVPDMSGLIHQTLREHVRGLGPKLSGEVAGLPTLLMRPDGLDLSTVVLLADKST